MMKLRKFWFKFDFKFGDGTSLGLMGCGVTAYSYEDAIEILENKVFHGEAPTPKQVAEDIDIDISKLYPKHVIPNMAMPLNRGVWFPLGYQ